MLSLVLDIERYDTKNEKKTIDIIHSTISIIEKLLFSICKTIKTGVPGDRRQNTFDTTYRNFRCDTWIYRNFRCDTWIYRNFRCDTWIYRNFHDSWIYRNIRYDVLIYRNSRCDISIYKKNRYDISHYDGGGGK